MKRREFLQKTALAAGAIVTNEMLCEMGEASADGGQAVNIPGNAAKVPQREYGKTGIKLSIIGLGGVLVMNSEQKYANRLVAEMIEQGVNYIDSSPGYGDSEAKLGQALKPYRKKVFIACKTNKRDKEGAAAELKESLKRLKTDYLDLYQVHSLTDLKKDVEPAFAKAGAMEVFIEAKKSGQIRFIGFTAHSEEAALAAMERYDFDSVLFPINFSAFYKKKFGQKLLAGIKSKPITLLAIKSLARQKWPKDDPNRKKYPKCWYQPTSDSQEAELAFRFTLSQPVTVAIAPGEEKLFRMALETARNFKPLTISEQQKLQNLAASLDPLFPLS